jgi:hypothetical protein
MSESVSKEFCALQHKQLNERMDRFEDGQREQFAQLTRMHNRMFVDNGTDSVQTSLRETKASLDRILVQLETAKPVVAKTGSSIKWGPFTFSGPLAERIAVWSVVLILLSGLWYVIHGHHRTTRLLESRILAPHTITNLVEAIRPDEIPH